MEFINQKIPVQTILFVYNIGNVGIETTAPSQRLHVVGNGLFTGTVTASCGLLVCSDIRYKKDITPLPKALTSIMKLQGRNFFWKTNEFPDKQFIDTNANRYNYSGHRENIS